MKTITKAYDVYSYDELDEAAKEKVLIEFSDINVEHDWYDGVFEQWVEKLHNIGFSSADIEFSGFYSQGDGACFSASPDLGALVTYLKFPKKDIEKIRQWEYQGKATGVIRTLGHMYSHENMRRFDIDADANDALIDRLTEKGEELRHDLSKQIYKDLKKSYEYLTSREAIEQTIRDNEYEFTKEGKFPAYL